jgi:hypothetical protein
LSIRRRLMRSDRCWTLVHFQHFQFFILVLFNGGLAHSAWHLKSQCTHWASSPSCPQTSHSSSLSLKKLEFHEKSPSTLFFLYSPVRSRLICCNFFFFFNFFNERLTTFSALWFVIVRTTAWTVPVSLRNLCNFRLEAEHVPAFVAFIAEQCLIWFFFAATNHATDTLS